MATFGICMAKDELDVIEGTVRHMADEVDHLIVADNGSTDGTREVLEELAAFMPLTVLDDPEPAYYQSDKMTALAVRAVSAGATWIVPFDADEVWLAPTRLRDVLADTEATVASAALFNHFCTAVDPVAVHPFDSIVWRQANPAPLPKVAFRWEPGAVIHQGNHGVSLPSGGQVEQLIEVRHFPYRSPEQFVSKARNGAAAYRAADLPENQGAHWRAYGDLLDRHGEDALRDVFRQHFWYLSPVDSGMVLDPAPFMRWQLP